MIKHKATQIAVVRCIFHDHVYYVAGSEEEINSAKEALRLGFEEVNIDFEEKTDSFLFWNGKKITVTDKARHMIGHSPKAIIAQGRVPTSRDASRWKKLLKGKYDQNGKET